MLPSPCWLPSGLITVINMDLEPSCRMEVSLSGLMTALRQHSLLAKGEYNSSKKHLSSPHPPTHPSYPSPSLPLNASYGVGKGRRGNVLNDVWGENDRFHRGTVCKQYNKSNQVPKLTSQALVQGRILFLDEFMSEFQNFHLCLNLIMDTAEMQLYALQYFQKRWHGYSAFWRWIHRDSAVLQSPPFSQLQTSRFSKQKLWNRVLAASSSLHPFVDHCNHFKVD